MPCITNTPLKPFRPLSTKQRISHTFLVSISTIENLICLWQTIKLKIKFLLIFFNNTTLYFITSFIFDNVYVFKSFQTIWSFFNYHEILLVWTLTEFRIHRKAFDSWNKLSAISTNLTDTKQFALLYHLSHLSRERFLTSPNM